jgi:ABC-2 type transport system ATP-binding protein
VDSGAQRLHPRVVAVHPVVERPAASKFHPRTDAMYRAGSHPAVMSDAAERGDMHQTVQTPRRRARGSSSEPVVSVRGLTKRYGNHEAVRGIDLEVERGEIFAFLGPNGAGKTTTVETLEGFRTRSGGDVAVLGVDPNLADGAWRDRVGVVLQESAPEPGLTVRECLRFYAGFYESPRGVDATIELVGLTEQAGTIGSELSGGQRRRLDVAMALIGDPELVFLDEPTTGFDPAARRAAWDVIAGLRELGTTVFLTTHFMDEAEYLADRIAVISGGRIVAEGTPATIGGREHMTSTIRFTLPEGAAIRDLPDGLRPLAEPGPDGQVAVRTESPLVHVQALAGWALGRGFDLPDLDVHRPSLEEVYLSLTQRTAAPVEEEP